MTGFSGNQHAIILLASTHLPDGQCEHTLHGICQPAGYLPAWFSAVFINAFYVWQAVEGMGWDQ